MAGNKNLAAAKANKKDEFYTQRVDIENELRHYKPHFAGPGPSAGGRLERGGRFLVLEAFPSPCKATFLPWKGRRQQKERLLSPLLSHYQVSLC